MTEPAQWPVARLRLIGSGLWILAGGLAVLGSFLPLIEQRNLPTSGATTGEAFTMWGVQGRASDIDILPPFGIPVVIAVLMLLVAAVLGLMSTRLHPATAPVLASRLIGIGGTGLLIGSVTPVFMLLRIFNQGSGDDEPFVNPYATTTGLGAWVLTAAGVLAIAAIVLMLVPKIAKRGEEPETPPMGIPVVRVLEPEYDEPAEAEQPTDPKG